MSALLWTVVVVLGCLLARPVIAVKRKLSA